MRVLEIFKSIHGECNGHHQGRFVTFIRVSGCNLKCKWGLTSEFKIAECDTVISQHFKNGKSMSTGDIIEKVHDLDNKYVCITGGEPLIHTSSMLTLVYNLHKRGYHISIETNGTLPIKPYIPYVESFVVDYKGFATGYDQKMLSSNHEIMTERDVLKFPISCEGEFIEALKIIKQAKEIGCKAIFAFSPVYGMVTPNELFYLIHYSGFTDCVLSVQLHKIIGVS